MLNEQTQKFIFEHIEQDTAKIALNPPKSNEIDLKAALMQIRSRSKARRKLPSLYENRELLFPAPVSVEQASSESTAKFKANIIEPGGNFADLTGGFGVDFMHLSKMFKNSYFIEQNKELCRIAEHNFKAMNIKNAEIINSTASEFLEKIQLKFDLIYLDPARRGGQGQKLIRLEYYSPNIKQLMPHLKNKAEQVIVKMSPMVDISSVLRLLGDVAKVYAVESESELKEILVCIHFSHTGVTEFIAAYSESMNCYVHSGSPDNFEFSPVKNYLYEPSPAVMKLSRFRFDGLELASLTKLAPNTHLFTSDAIIEKYPGNLYEVTATVKYDRKLVKQLLPENKANVKCRNFPQTPDEIKKKLAIKDGGEQFLFAYRDLNNKPKIAVCKKLADHS